MRNLLGNILFFPLGILMSGPFAIIGRIGGLVIGLAIGLFVGIKYF